MNKKRVLLVAVALGLLSMPVVAHAQPATPASPRPVVKLAAAEVFPVAHDLTPAELRYHRETVEHMQGGTAIQSAFPTAESLPQAKAG
jgi:hypothetical protein